MNEYEQKDLTRFLPKLPAVKVKIEYWDDDPKLPAYDIRLKKDKIYLVLGEVGDINHYILLDYATGTIMPGIYHLDNLIRLDNDEL